MLFFSANEAVEILHFASSEVTNYSVPRAHARAYPASWVIWLYFHYIKIKRVPIIIPAHAFPNQLQAD